MNTDTYLYVCISVYVFRAYSNTNTLVLEDIHWNSFSVFWGKLTNEEITNEEETVYAQHYCKRSQREKRWGPISAAYTVRNTHCVTLCASRWRSSSLLTIARSPPRSEHCCRASVQLNSPGTIWKQREDSAWYTPSFGQWGEAGREQRHSRDFPDRLKSYLQHSGKIQSIAKKMIFKRLDLLSKVQILLFYMLIATTKA